MESEAGGSKSATTLEALESVDPEALSTRVKAIAVTLGWMTSVEGFSKAETARFYGKSRPWVSARLREMEDELRAHVEQRRAAASS